MRVSHLTPVIMLLVAAAWRWRDTRGAPGVLIGLAVAIKFFVWPVGVWLAATRRVADAALAAAVAAFSLLLVLPFTSLHDYVDALTRLGRVFDQDSYNVYGLLVQAGASDAGRARRDARRRRGAPRGDVAVPEPRARARGGVRALSHRLARLLHPRRAAARAGASAALAAIWFVPLVTWGAEGAGIGIGDVRTDVRVLVVFCVVLAVAFRGEPRDAGDVRPAT